MDFTLNRPQIFPEGTEVGAYSITNWPTLPSDPQGEPEGDPVSTATVTDGVATFTGLTAGEHYWATADVDGFRYIGFSIALPGGFDPAQITPSDTDGQVLTTVDGLTAWADGGGGGGGIGTIVAVGVVNLNDGTITTGTGFTVTFEGAGYVVVVLDAPIDGEGLLLASSTDDFPPTIVAVSSTPSPDTFDLKTLDPATGDQAAAVAAFTVIQVS